jgi:menaquinone-9 beta-reductase
MKNKIYDAIIIGAGPAGSAAAVTLSKQGHSVLLIDQFTFPREKICGDGLTGNSIRMFNKLGIWDKIEPLVNRSSRAELFHTINSSFTLNVSAYMLKREKLDNILLEHALSCGTNFQALKFTGKIKHEKEYSTLEVIDSESLETKQIKAKYILLAMGCQFTGALKNIKSINIKKPDLIAIRGYFQADWNINHILIFFIGKNKNDGYLWIFPMGNNEYNIGCGRSVNQKINLKKTLNEFIGKYSEIKKTTGHWTSPPKGAFLRTDLSNSKYASFDNILLAGETLGSTFPLTGEGIAKALETGIMAAETIHKALINNDISCLKEYNKRIKKELKIKYLPYRFSNYILKFRIVNEIFKFNIVNKIFFTFTIRCIRLCNRISKKLKDGKTGKL